MACSFHTGCRVGRWRVVQTVKLFRRSSTRTTATGSTTTRLQAKRTVMQRHFKQLQPSRPGSQLQEEGNTHQKVYHQLAQAVAERVAAEGVAERVAERVADRVAERVAEQVAEANPEPQREEPLFLLVVVLHLRVCSQQRMSQWRPRRRVHTAGKGW